MSGAEAGPGVDRRDRHAPEDPAHDRHTIAGYERCAGDYAQATAPVADGAVHPALRRFAEALPAGGRVLDVGSGPGWDADALESLGLRVRRTDATEAFRDLQARRGARVDRLDLLADPIPLPPGGAYDGAMMLCVIQHFERTQAAGALRKLAGALQPGGTLLLSYAVGDGAAWERRASGDYRVVRWRDADMDALLARSGFAVAWAQPERFDDGPWRNVLARRRA